MKKLFFLCLTACVGMWASAQKVYFLYLQSDDQSPFYVRMGDKIHSSAASGFLILPNLTDSNYTFGLGFAKSTESESSFSVNINQNDKGFVIKKFDDGLALFDFRDLSVVKANSAHKDNTVYETKSDKFSSILSKAASDPSILKVPVTKKEEPASPKPGEKEKVTAKLDETRQVEKTTADTAVTQAVPEPQTQTAQVSNQKTENTEAGSVVEQSVSGNEKKETAPSVAVENKKEEAPPVVETIAKNEDSAPITAAFKPSVVTRYSESSTTEGFSVVYYDKKSEGIDTIRILIPASKVKLVAGNNTSATNDNVPVGRDEVAVPAKQDEKTPAVAMQPSKNEVANISSCKSIASDKDFIKLRKKMAARENEDNMLDEARKDFRSRCYSVEQVRYLSTLFLTSASKYQLFDAAFPFVTDKSNFGSLGAEIRDEHYTKRFKALIGE